MKQTVFVVMGNDFPDAVFSTNDAAVKYCEKKQKATLRVYWRVYEFVMNEGDVSDTADGFERGTKMNQAEQMREKAEKVAQLEHKNATDDIQLSTAFRIARDIRAIPLPEDSQDLLAKAKEIIERYREERRLVRMKDCDVVYDVTLNVEASLALAAIDQALKGIAP